MNNSVLLLPEPSYATPLHASLQPNPFASSKSLAPFSPEENALPAYRSSRAARLTTPLHIDTTLFQQYGEPQGRRSVVTRQKRRTLPVQLPLARGQNQCLQGLLSPSHLAKLSPRINFTYRTPANNSRSQLTTTPFVLYKENSKMELKWPLMRRKAQRCKLSSNQFNFTFVPKRINKIEDYNCTLTNSIRTIPIDDEPERSIPFHFNHSPRKIGCQSKVASTTASSGIPLHNSNLSHADYAFPRQNSSQIGLLGSGRNLLDSIPSKQLGRTVILPTHYSFGGLIDRPYAFDAGKKQAMVQLQARQWRNHFRLLADDDEEDMKESIHCGPQLRSQHKFEMLGGYGREIKESTTSFCE